MPDTTEDESPPVVTAAGVNGYHHLHHQPRWSKANLTSSSAEREPLMMMDLDLDLDLEAPWLLDVSTTTSAANPTPSFLLSAASELPCSPLWGYSDENNGDKPNGNYVSGGSFYPRLFSYITDTVTPDPGQENTTTNEENKKPPPPNLSITQLSDSSCIIKERMTQALRYFKESHSTGQHVLAQVWAPVKTGTKYELTTSGQPFVVDPNSNGLHQYRMISLMYKFSVDGETNGVLGLPGRVFRQKLPEWTPNVQYYSSKEFSRLNHALHYNVQGTLALPVFEPSGQSCIGVLELIMTSPKIHYAPDVDKVCKALELVNLRSSEILDQPNTQISNEGRQNALVEILEILTVLCESHKLPLAQTWVPCRHRSVLAYGGGLMKSCSSFDGHCMGQICMSTTEVAFYLVDAHMWGFREACAEHHLQKGQGVAGRAFSSHGSCFCPDITKFCKTEYPLVHYARMFGLSGSFAICLQSSYTGDDEYVLEFFLPPSVSDHRDQRNLLDSLLMMMKPHFRSLRSASGKEIEHEWNSVEVIMASMNEKVEEVENSKMGFESFEEQHIVLTYNALNGGGNGGGGGGNSGGGVQNVVGSVLETKGVVKKPERKRGKAEKTISLEVLQQYFAGSLKDAAKSLGVCPTTMKRICRQHGISRWPSRKINKVNRSLSKLKRVIESVQGTEGTFALTSLASSSLPVAVGSISWPASMNGPGPVPTGPTSSQQQYSPNSKPPLLDEFYPHKIPPPDEHMLKNERSSESGEESTGTPTSEASCQGSPGQDNPGPVNVGPLPLPNKQTDRPSINLSAIFSTPEAFVSTHNQEAFRGILIEDAGSSQDLRNLGENLEYSWTNPGPAGPVGPDTKVPKFSARPEMKTITIKATYKEDIIRFRISRNSGIDKLKEEVAKRLKLEMGSFEIKYLDDDHEWVLIACDVDLQECVEISRSSGGNIIRLLVHDMMTILGSSCESSG